MLPFLFLFIVKMLSCFLLDRIYLEVFENDATLFVYLQEQVPIGSAEVRAVFSSGSGRVAGCMVTEGKVVEGCGIRVTRKGKEVHVGVVESLRRVKEAVKEVYKQTLFFRNLGKRDIMPSVFLYQERNKN